MSCFLCGNLITLSGIHNTDDVMAFSVFISRAKCREISFKKSALSFNEVHKFFQPASTSWNYYCQRASTKNSLKIPFQTFHFNLTKFYFQKILQGLHMTLQKVVANMSEQFRATTSKPGSTLTLLAKNLIYSIGKLLRISSRDADFANLQTPLQKMVCSNIKFYL